MKTKSTLFVIFLVLFFVACDLNHTDIDDEIALTEKTARLIEAENDFGFELFQNIYATETGYNNIMVSPLSVSLALAMTYNGAESETKTAMEKTLKVYGLTPNEINVSYRDLVHALQSLDEKVLLEIANAIYYRDDFNVENEFISINKNYYNAEVSALDFSSPEALNTINGWVADKTHDKIKTILKKITPQQVMFLLNIDYVKHKTFIEVNEEGTEAAAVTIVAMERNSVNKPQKVPFYVNRPFLYAITEKDTGAILFIGTVKNPQLN